jgi:hypothetical protein
MEGLTLVEGDILAEGLIDLLTLAEGLIDRDTDADGD